VDYPAQVFITQGNSVSVKVEAEDNLQPGLQTQVRGNTLQIFYKADEGEDWAVAHAKRLIELVKQISGDLPYDAHVMELAAYMHDWGAFPVYFQKDVEHAVRSRQVVESEILPRLPLTANQKETLLETIELHDYRDLRPTQSNEALLLCEADMLEFLGMIGMARENLKISRKRLPSALYRRTSR
jgi:HD superfamily phosphodiesterase